MAAPFASYSAEKGTGRREFLDAPVPGIGDQNVSVAIKSNSSWRIKLPLARSLSAFRHVSHPFAQGTELGSCRKCAYAVLKLLNVLVRNVQYVKRPYFAAKGI